MMEKSLLYSINQDNRPYLKVIQALLKGSDSTKLEILQDHQDRIDVNLLDVMLQVAAILTGQEDLSSCDLLIKLARQLLGIYADRPLEGMSAEFALGNISLDMKEFSQARNYHHQALDIFRKLNDSIGEANALAVIGDSLYEQDSFSQAIEYYKQAQTIFQETGAQQSEGMLLKKMVFCYYFMSQSGEAINLSKRRLKISQELGLRAITADSLYDLGMIYQATGKILEAGRYFNKSWTISREIGADELEALSFKGLKNFYSHTDGFDFMGLN
jgi:tetratricopeptide (TPR) repeat protein